MESDGYKDTLKVEVEIDGRNSLLWFQVDSEFGPYLCVERSDAFVIAVLNYAMRYGHDIQCETPLTEDLYYNLEKYLIDALVNYNPHFYRTRIQAPIASDNLSSKGAVGTGISCGVDSLQVLSSQSNMKFSGHNINFLTLNNVGSHGEGEKAQLLFERRKRRAEQFAEEYGYQLVISDSNLHEVIPQSHFLSHTYSSLFAVYCLQKLFSVFYYASAGLKYEEFSLVDVPQRCSGSYEFISLPYFSTRTLRIYSGGEGMTRMEKIREISSYRPSYKYLNVCLEEDNNCGRCEKCVRTILALDALGVLYKYHEVFDLDYYQKNRTWYLSQMLFWLHQGKHDYYEIYHSLKTQISFSLILKQYASYGWKSFIYLTSHYFYYRFILRKEYI